MNRYTPEFIEQNGGIVASCHVCDRDFMCFGLLGGMAECGRCYSRRQNGLLNIIEHRKYMAQKRKLQKKNSKN